VSDHAPSVTCVLIFLDGARFIEEAIESVVAQGDDIDWELVLVDDGSTDESTAIALRWADADARIRYLEHEGHANLGMSASRNAGVAAARGEVIGFLDCDDVWLPTALAHGVRVFSAHPQAEVVIGATWRWYSWTGDPADRPNDHLMSLPDVVTDTVVEPPALFAAMYAIPGGWRIPAMCSLLLARRALLRIGGLDDSFRGIYEDQVLYAKIAVHLRTVVDPRPMALYRQHDASACHVADAAGVWRRSGPSELERHYLEWVRTYVTEDAGGDPAVLDVVAHNLDHVARGEHLAPTEPSPPRLRRHVPASVRRVLRAVRDRARPPARPTTVAEHWSKQFLGGISGEPEGATLVVDATDGVGPWTAVLPADAFGGRVQHCTWSEAASAATRFDRVVVPLDVGAAVGTAELLPVMGRRLRPDGRALVMVPGPALDPACPSADAVVDLVHAVLLDHRVDVEPFGNEVTAALLDEAVTAIGATVDCHDRVVPAVLGITITPARCGR
jgi:hypothetical protein